MRLIPCLVLAALVSQGCKSCKQPGEPRVPELVEGGGPLEATSRPPEPVEGTPDAAAAPDLPAVDAASLGLESPDPDQDTIKLTTSFGPWANLIKGDLEKAHEAIEEALDEHPGNLHVLTIKAGLLLHEGEAGEALGLFEQILLAGFPEFSPTIMDLPSVRYHEDAERKKQLEQLDKAVGKAWAAAMSRSGVFLLVAPAFPEGNLGEPEEEKLNRGWVVYLDATTRRFLPITARANVAGFILDRAERRLYTVSWKSYNREQLDGEGEPIRPALLQSTRISYVDLDTFEASPEVDLGTDLVEARISIRSGHVLASVVHLDFEANEGIESSLEIDCSGFKSRPAAKAPPGPMDLIVSYGTIEPPTSDYTTQDADTLPSGWACIEPDETRRLCAVPTAKESVLHDLVLEETMDEKQVKTTLAESVGILQMDVL